MIKLFLRAKHWQLFILLFGIPLSFQFFIVFSNFGFISNSFIKYNIDYYQFFPIIMFVFIGLFFSWFWSIVFGLKDKIPTKIKLNTNKFRFFLLFSQVSNFFLIIYMSGFFKDLKIDGLGDWIYVIIILLQIFTMFCFFYTMYFVAKTIKTVELKREVVFEDFIGEFFLLWFYFVGIWVIQPKINKLANSESKATK